MRLGVLVLEKIDGSFESIVDYNIDGLKNKMKELKDDEKKNDYVRSLLYLAPDKRKRYKPGKESKKRTPKKEK